MLRGLLIWGGAYTAFAFGVSFLSTPERKLPAYFLFEMICLAPWTVWLFWMAAKRGAETMVGVVVQACVVLAVVYPIEIAGTFGKLWDFFEDKDSLIGVRLGGLPIEEFFFYPLTINFAVLLYLLVCDSLRSRRVPDIEVGSRRLFLGLGCAAAVFAGLGLYVLALRDSGAVVDAVRLWDDHGLPRYAEGPRSYRWTLIALFSLAVNMFVFYVAERHTALMLRAVIVLSGVFFLVNLLVELMGTSRGWWVYNGQQTSGMWVAAVPLENLPVYLTGVTLSLALFEATRRLMGAKGMP